MNDVLTRMNDENARLRGALSQIKDFLDDPDINSIDGQVLTLDLIDDMLAEKSKPVTRKDLMDDYVATFCWGAIFGIGIALMRIYL